MIDNSALENILRYATDISVVCEIYSADTVPTDDGFDPADALRCFSRGAGVSFRGQNYEQILKSIGGIKRTITNETNTASVDFTNVSREIAAFEFAEGFEGKIKVIRLISRSQSIELSDSQILFVGRCEKPKSGTKASLSVSSKFILGALEPEIPRRKYTATDDEGRVSTDKLFEGFLFIPQYGTTSYSVRQKRGGIFGLLGFKKTVWKTINYSSYSDLDANTSVAEVFGRAQMIGLHIGYRDVGSAIQMIVAFCEGEIADFLNTRSTDARLPLSPTSYAEILGKLGGVDEQTPDDLWVAPGYYSRTAHIRCQGDNSEVSEVDPAPDVVSVVLGRILTVPDVDSGEWSESGWSDNGAAIARFALTSEDYYKLDENWIDDESFFEVHKFNDEILFDSSLSDFLFIPDSGFEGFLSEDSDSANLLPTSSITPEYFKYLHSSGALVDAFGQKARSFDYDSEGESRPIEPPDPDEPPGGGGSSNNLAYFLRRRYTCNTVITEKMKVMDFIHNVVFPSSRMFFSQSASGKIKLNSKKPVDWALGEAEFEIDTNIIALDDVSKWIENKTGFLLIDPHTDKSEVRAVSGANYSIDQNDIVLTVSDELSTSGFSGGDGEDVPATATITVDDPDSGVESNITLDGIEIAFIATDADTVETVAAFIYASVNAHPQLKRRFSATLDGAIVTVKAKFGTLTLDKDLEFSHAEPIANPTDAPVLTAVSGGDLEAGDYRVAYSYKNEHGQTLLSPFETVTLAADEKISVDAITPPADALISWYVVPAKDSAKLRFHSSNDGSAFEINSLPLLTAPLPPDLNRTATEVLRVAAVFSDRKESRTNAARSNVIDASFEWILGNREKSINRVDLKFRDSTQDFRLVELRLRDDAHIAKTKKTSNVEVNGQAIDNYNQAYRIASGILAEQRDADFFYKWSATREALLLEEGDVVAITDDGSGVINLPVRIEAIDFDLNKELPKATFTARKYSTTLYDDQVSERTIPVIIEP